MGAWQGMYWSLISFPIRFPLLVKPVSSGTRTRHGPIDSAPFPYRQTLSPGTPQHGQAVRMLVNECNHGETPCQTLQRYVVHLGYKVLPRSYSSFSFLTTHSLYLIHRSSPISLVFNTSILNYQRK
jgi:hypothetical protein